MEELNKPHVLYALPRSRSTAILQSSKKDKKLFEPFSPIIAFKLGDNSHIYKNWYDPITIDKWELIKDSLNDTDSISKILGSHLNFPLAKKWFNDIQTNYSSEIFVVDRNLYDVCWSFLIALQIGWFKQTERTKKSLDIKEEYFNQLIIHIKSFIQYMPFNAKIISWEKLPEEHFSKLLNVKIKDQNTLNRRKDMVNYNYVDQQIRNIVEVYNPQIDEKLSSLQWAV